MFRQLLAFEWGYHTRQVSFALSALLALLIGLQMGGNLRSGPQVFINAPSHINYMGTLFAMSSIFVLMVTCANAMLRDSDSKMSELVFATAIEKWTLLGSRFVGAIGAAFSVMFIAMFGAFISVFMPWVDPETVGPITPWYHLWSLFVIILPSMLFSGAIIFSVAALTRSMIATYLSAAAVYAGYMMIAAAGGSPMFVMGTPPSPETFALAAQFDPFAITTFYYQTQFWTPLQQNQQMLALDGLMLTNRLLFAGIGLLLLAGLNQVYKLQLPKQKRAKTKAVKSTSVESFKYKVMTPVDGWLASRAAWWSSLKLEMGLVLKSKPFIAMIALWCLLILNETLNTLTNLEFGPQAYPTTTLILSAFQFDVLMRFGSIFIVYYSAEIFWRERNVNINVFIDSMPVSNPVLFSTKLITLLMVPFTMIVACIVIGIGIQLSKGYTHLEPTLYLSVFFYTGLPLAYVAVMALLMQTLSKNKYLGMVLTAALVILTGKTVAASLGLSHPMFNFAQVPVLNYTAMNGYADSNDAFVWYMLYWGSMTALFAILSFVMWPRGAEFGFKHRFNQLHQAPKAKVAMLVCAAVLLTSGGYIFNQTNVVGHYQTRSQNQQKQADYEKLYKQYQGLAQPSITAINLDAALYPQQRRYLIKGEYVLTNKTPKTISRLLVSPSWDISKVDVRVKTAKSTEYNEQFNTHWFDLAKPLAPGQSVKMEVDIEDSQSGFAANSSRNNMLQNGAYVMLNIVSPVLGYRSSREIRSKTIREKYQLAPRAEDETLEEAIGRTGGDFSAEYDWIDYQATVSTEINQIAISQGSLLKQWQANNRQHYQYKSKQPIRNIISFHSGRYEVKKVQHGDVSVEVYYHKTHGTNVEHMITAVKDSLDYFSANFSPYPHDHLRITEVPASNGSRSTGFASPGNILLSNHGGFISNLNSNYAVDQVYRRVAHEVAHQWWGYQLDPALIQGNLVMVETLAKYSEMRILQNRYGQAQVRDLIQFESRRYLRGRSNAGTEENPLYKATGSQNHILYSKGGYVMYTLTHLLGEKTMNAIMSTLINDFAYPNKPPTSLDFIDVLYAVAPKATHRKIDELMKQIVMYDLALDDAQYTKLDDGRYRVDVKVKTQKNAFSGLGEPTPMVMNEDIEIGIFNQFPEGEQIQSGALMLKMQSIKGEIGQFSFIVDQKPAFVVIDPNYYQIDSNRENNLYRL